MTLAPGAGEAAGQEVALPPAAAEEALEVGEVRRALAQGESVDKC